MARRLESLKKSEMLPAMEQMWRGPMSLEAAREIAAWRYPAPYDVYNMPDWEYLLSTAAPITQSQWHHEFTAVGLDEDPLVGWFRIHDGRDGLTFTNGIRPDLCGHGLSVALMALAEENMLDLHRGRPIRLSVRPGNLRAIAAYERAGYMRLVAPPVDNGMVWMEKRAAENPCRGTRRFYA